MLQREIFKSYIGHFFVLEGILPKAFLNKYVFRSCLKTSVVCGALRWSGRAFHSLGAAAEKARSPMVRSLVLGA